MDSDPSAHRSHGVGAYRLWFILAFGAAVALAVPLAPHFSYDRLDNLEYFTPPILLAHLRWLHGQLPLWTSHQYLGEPLLAYGQPGVFYPIYTAAVAIVESLGRPGWLMAVVAAFHFALGLLGWLILFESLGIRRWLAGATALSVEGGGFAALTIPLWTFMGGSCAGCRGSCTEASALCAIQTIHAGSGSRWVSCSWRPSVIHRCWPTRGSGSWSRLGSSAGRNASRSEAGDGGPAF